MSLFTVEYASLAADQLAEIWMNAKDRKTINEATVRIDRSLARDPIEFGTHMSEGLYGLDAFPLRVTFSIDHSQRHVEVQSVRLIP